VLWMLAPRGIPGRLVGSVWMLPMALLVPPAVPVGDARIVVLDVGQGLAVFIATATHTLVYDTGPRFNDSVDAGGRIVAPFLRAAGVTKLDALIVSHADTDHSGGALSLLRAVPVAAFRSSLQDGHPIVAEASRNAASTRCIAGSTWEWDGVTWMQVASSGPSPRNRHAMAYDALRQQVIIQGGTTDGVDVLDDTWAYTPATCP